MSSVESARTAAIKALREIVDNNSNPTGMRITAAREIILATQPTSAKDA